MPANPGHIANRSCDGRGSCCYLGELSRLERLTGATAIADVLETIAAPRDRCGCIDETPCFEQIAWPAASQPALFRKKFAAPRREIVARAHGGAAPIPLAPGAAANVISDGQGNRIEQRELKYDTLDAADSLRYLYQYWRWLRGATACQFSDVDTVHLIRSNIIGRLHVVDVASSDPQDFRFELLGYGVPIRRCDKPRSHPVPILADSVIRDYNTVRLTGVPRVHRVRARLEGVIGHYTRLILPFFARDGRVTRLAVAIQREVGDGIRLGPGPLSSRRRSSAISAS